MKTPYINVLYCQKCHSWHSKIFILRGLIENPKKGYKKTQTDGIIGYCFEFNVPKLFTNTQSQPTLAY